MFLPQFKNIFKDLILNHKTVKGNMSEYTILGRDPAGVAQWIEHRHANQRVPGSIPSQGTDVGCTPGLY